MLSAGLLTKEGVSLKTSYLVYVFIKLHYEFVLL